MGPYLGPHVVTLGAIGKVYETFWPAGGGCAATRDFLPYIYFGVGPCSGPAPYAVFPLQPSPAVDLRY